MSTDINLSRPSTRVRASPGGATTICFGDETVTTTKPPTPPMSVASSSPLTIPAPAPVIAVPEGTTHYRFGEIEYLS